MESQNPKFALYGGKHDCVPTDTEVSTMVVILVITYELFQPTLKFKFLVNY